MAPNYSLGKRFVGSTSWRFQRNSFEELSNDGTEHIIIIIIIIAISFPWTKDRTIALLPSNSRKGDVVDWWNGMFVGMQSLSEVRSASATSLVCSRLPIPKGPSRKGRRERKSVGKGRMGQRGQSWRSITGFFLFVHVFSWWAPPSLSTPYYWTERC